MNSYGQKLISLCTLAGRSYLYRKSADLYLLHNKVRKVVEACSRRVRLPEQLIIIFCDQISLTPNVKTLVGTWKRKASTIIMYKTNLSLRSSYMTRLSREYKTKDCPVTIAYQPGELMARAIYLFENTSK